MLRSIKIIKSEFITHTTHGFLEQSCCEAANEKLLYQRAALLRQMHLNNTVIYASMMLITAISLYVMMF